MVYHREVFGYLEARTRRDLNQPGRNEVEIRFKTIKFGADARSQSLLEEELHVSSNQTCSICCVDFEPGTEVVCLPCNVTRSEEPAQVSYMHTFHPDCLQSQRSFDMASCPMCRTDISAQDQKLIMGKAKK